VDGDDYSVHVLTWVKVGVMQSIANESFHIRFERLRNQQGHSHWFCIDAIESVPVDQPADSMREVALPCSNI
jgi:hypothetical protein